MKGPKLELLSLSESERSELQRLPCGPNTSQQIMLRANIGLKNSQIAQQLELTPETVRMWRKRWLAGFPSYRAFRSFCARAAQRCSQARAAFGDQRRTGLPNSSIGL